MVTTAALLLRERGVARTSVAQVLDHSHGPRGSVGFHFPGGRAELLTDALHWAGETVTARLRTAVDHGTPPADIYRDVCDHYRSQLLATNFTAGCPIWAAAQEAYDDPDLGPVATAIINDWVSLLAESLVRAGHTPQSATQTALLSVGAMEGAITMARIQHSTQPLDLTLAALLPLLAQA